MTLAYVCGLCARKCSEPEGSVLAMLAICQGCQAKRYAEGLKDQRRADAGGSR